MLYGLAASSAGMAVQSQRLDVIAQNLANVDTAGYQRQVLTTGAFAAQLSNALADTLSAPAATPVRADYLTLATTTTCDHSEGMQRPTGHALDFAIPGDAYFTVQLADGSQALTRNGAFMLNNAQQLVTVASTIDPATGAAGHPLVLGAQGPITIDQPNWEVTRQGDVVVGGKTVDRLKLMTHSGTPTAVDNGFWSPSGALPAGAGTAVTQGALLGSNVNAVTEMVTMISATRSFEANQRCMQIQDATLDRAVNDIGRV